MSKPNNGKVCKRAKPVGSGGSRKGIPNKTTAQAREAISQFVEANTDRLQGWLDQIAETDGPKVAFQCLMDVLEYHIPKLARTELTGKDGGPVVVAASREDERL